MRERVLAVAVCALMLVGCRSTGITSTETGISLVGSNYKVVKAGAKGESYGFYLLGFIPVVSPNFADAKASLYASVVSPSRVAR